MTKDEALKLALEALHGFIPYLPLNDEVQCGRYDKAITAIKEALAQPAVTESHKQEPVAFVKGCNKGQWEIFPAKAYQIFEREQPLYTSPQPVQQQEQLREENERLHVENRRLIDRIETIGVPVGVGGFATTTTAQRTWVGLTDKEIDQGLCRTNYAMQTAGAWRDGVDWAIKQLREKNNG